MFNKIEIKEFVVKLGKRWLFPNFSNRITWATVTLGTAVILAPTPFKVIFYNWLVDTFNLNSGLHFSLAEISSGSADYWIGFALITAALAHNLFGKWVELHVSESQLQNNASLLEADRLLFQRFLYEFPSGSRSIYLLQEHDFGNSFNLDSLKEIDSFVDNWKHAETTFLNSELENLKCQLWKKSHEFNWLLARKSAPTCGGRMQSVVPDQHRDDWNWPEWVDKDVQEVNGLASEVTDLHQKFILNGKQLLKC